MTTATLLVILNLIILESLLSVDNAAVLAIMVKDLPDRQSNKALRYGIWGAIIFRGLCLLVASTLIKLVWLKIAGGCFLFWLVYGHFTVANDSLEEASETKDSRIFKWANGLGISRFWSTVILVEIMDLSFSIDNIFAAVALSDQFWVIFVGVVVGIIAMRFVAGWFVNMIKKFPTLANSAFIVIGILGLKLVISGILNYVNGFEDIKLFMNTHTFDFSFSGIMMVIFFVPLLFRKK